MSLPTGAEACEREAIHVPGAIQPHGVLVALAPHGFSITQISSNCAALFGLSPDQALGQPLAALLGDAATPVLATLHAAESTVGETLVLDLNGNALDVLVHHHDGVAILEFEPHDQAVATSDALLRSALSRLQRPQSVSDVCAAVVEEVRKLTGFDRVLLYRFDDEGHGDVIEESKAEGVDAYCGLRFPASDIPPQARALYVLNWLRLIPNASYVPVPLVPERRPDTQTALDLSFSTLRSVSPVHLEYLRNMGVQASMSVSLVREGKLWGLIACHHRAPHHISFAARAACEVIGRVVSLQIDALEEVESRRLRGALDGAEAKLVEAMRDAPEEAALALFRRGDALMALVAATGAALCTPTKVRTVGVTPDAAQLGALVAWLVKERAGGVFHSDRLSELYPPSAEYVHLASGVVALTLPGATSTHLLWFRPEILRTVTWAGNPTKPLEAGDDGTRLHPRHSFQAWKQVLRARARPWLPAELDAVEDLRRRAIEIDLGKQIARAELAVRHRDETVAILSHDLKTPLQVIQLASGILRSNVRGDAIGEATVDRLDRAVARMSGLIHDLLDLAKIEAGRFELASARCLVGQLMSDAFHILTPIADAKGVRLSWHGDSEACVQADADRVFQVIFQLGRQCRQVHTPRRLGVGQRASAAERHGALRRARYRPGYPFRGARSHL